MIIQEQRDWLEHLSDTDIISIAPYDSTSAEKFLKIKKKIQSVFGSSQPVEHRGSSSLQISGQDEIDVYVPVTVKKFDAAFQKLTVLFGQPRSHYPKKRTRFVTSISHKHIDVFLVNQDGNEWRDSEIFYNYLLNHTDVLDSYRRLKESCSGFSTQAYYRKKIEFINKILAVA